LGESELVDIDHVMTVYSSKFDNYSVSSDFKDQNNDGYIDLLYSNAYIISSVTQGGFEESLKTGEAICPIEFYPSSKAYNLVINKKYILDSEEIVGSKFKVTYYKNFQDDENLIDVEEFSKEFKIVELYDSNRVLNTSNSCYISADDVISMKNDISNDVDGTYFDFVVVVDGVENVIDVQNKILSLGFLDASVRSTIDYDSVNLLFFLSNFFISIVLFVIVVVTISNIKKQM